jgi:hypothetical protein
MSLSLRNPSFVGSLARAAAAPVAESRVYDFSGSVYTRFFGGGMTATPTEYTLAAWLRPAQVLNNAGIFTRSGGDPSSGWSHAMHQNGATNWIAYTYDGSVKNVYGTTVVAVNTWYHVTVSAKNGGQMRLYVNGAQEGTPSPITTLWGSGNDWWIAVDNGSTTVNFSGYMCDAAIWNKQLSDAQILSLATGARNLPPTIELANLLLFCPMNDAPTGGALTGAWTETVGGLTQTRTGQVIGRVSQPP